MPEQEVVNTNESEEILNDECTATFKPVVTLPIVPIRTFEEDEEILLKLRAKLYRFDATSEEPEWKERGTGEMKVLKHRKNKTVRIVMRRDKTLKVCANHFIEPYCELKPVKCSERAYIYTSLADYADETPKRECFAIKFTNAENANKFKDVFNESKSFVQGDEAYDEGENDTDDEEDENVASKMNELNISHDDIPCENQ